jgi:uncharacterized membrane protein
MFIGHLLRFGVVLAALVVLGGGILFLYRHGTELADHRAFELEPADLRNPVGIIQDALHGRGRGWIQLGVLLLIATPVARVFFSIIAFWLERDRLYVAFTLIVLTFLLYGLFGGVP